MATKRLTRSASSKIPSTEPHLGTVLITGGCGFIGSHLVSGFLSEPTCTSIHVVSRNPKTNLHEGVTYHSADICDITSMRSLLTKIQPTVIIHASSPSPVTGTTSMFSAVTIRGTQNLLTIAAETESVKAFVYTSSSTMSAGMCHINLPESAPLADSERFSHPYARTKAIADTLVLEFNETGRSASTPSEELLRTGTIRLPIVYGPGDPWGTPSSLEALRTNQTSIRLGNGKNKWSMCSISNAVYGHILLCKHLLLHTPGVSAEAYHIHDGKDILFWDFPRGVWKAAGGNPAPIEEMIGIPVWILLPIAYVLEWLFWVFTVGRKRPQLMGVQQVQYTCYEHTYSIEKARTRLGFTPKGCWEDGVQEAVDWQLDHDGWREKLKGKVKGS